MQRVGGEDLDLYEGFELPLACGARDFPARLLSALPHPDSQRNRVSRHRRQGIDQQRQPASIRTSSSI
jgi:hypothetical protein